MRETIWRSSSNLCGGPSWASVAFSLPSSTGWSPSRVPQGTRLIPADKTTVCQVRSRNEESVGVWILDPFTCKPPLCQQKFSRLPTHAKNLGIVVCRNAPFSRKPECKTRISASYQMKEGLRRYSERQGRLLGSFLLRLRTRHFAS